MGMPKTWKFGALTLIAILSLLILACGDDEGDGGSNGAATTTAAADEPTGDAADDATAQLCDDLDALEAAVFEFQALNETNTVDEWRAARDDIDQAFEDVATSAAAVETARIEDLEASFDTLDETVTSIEGDQTIAEVQADLQDAAVDVLVNQAELKDGANCPASSTATP
jgi:hypothetical protein